MLTGKYVDPGLQSVHLQLKRMGSVTGPSFSRDSKIDHNAAD